MSMARTWGIYSGGSRKENGPYSKAESQAVRQAKDARKPHRDERALFKFEMRERRDELRLRGRIEQTACRKILRVAGLRSVKRRGIHKRQFHVSGAWLEAQWQPKKR
jgi:hypothetical protein